MDNLRREDKALKKTVKELKVWIYLAFLYLIFFSFCDGIVKLFSLTVLKMESVSEV